jgi:hypothetical protein
MPLISTSIPNLVGGVSQQPAAIRSLNEATRIDNAVPSPVEGLIKRPPTERVASIENGSGNARWSLYSEPPFIHLIERDETERYFLVIQQDGSTNIYDTAGNRKTLYIDAGVTLGTADRTDRRAVTLGDITFIANRSSSYVTEAQGTLTTQTPSNYNRSGLVWIKQSNYNRAHTLKLTSSGGITSTFTHTTREPSITNNGSSGTNGTYTLVQATLVSGTALATYPLINVTVAGNKVTRVTIAQDGSGYPALLDTVLSANSADIGGTLNFQFKMTAPTNSDIGTNHIAEDLFKGTSLGYIGPDGGIDNHLVYGASTYVDNVIYLQSTTDFTAVVEDDFAGDGLVFIRNQVSRFEDLPPTAPNGYMVKIVGSPESTVDDYWVQFKADNGTFSRGIWVEVAAPGLKYKWNYSKMPAILIRQSDGTFMLKYADGTTPGTGVPAGASYTTYKWADRLVGDDTTNPFPSFLGQRVQDMVIYQNRLGIMSGDNIVFSEVGQFFNFFRVITADLLDSDVIDLTSTNARVANIMAAVPFNRDLILFSPTSQMVIRGGEVLSPKSVTIIPAAEFENQGKNIRPIAAANSIFFTYNNGNYAGMRELVPQPSLDGSYLANDLSLNIPKYLPKALTHMAAAAHDNIVVLVAEDGLYLYRYYQNNSQRVQSAWHRFIFNDSNSNTYSKAVPIWAGFIESELYVVFQRTRDATSGFLTIEKIRMGVGLDDSAVSGKSWLTNLDQRKYFSAGSGSYNSTTGRTTFTLQKPMSYAAGKTTVVTTEGQILSVVGGTAFSDPTAGTVVVSGDWSATAVWIGTTYEMLYEFSTPYLRSSAAGSPVAIISGRYQLRYLDLQYADTGYFRVNVSIADEDTYEYPFTGEILGGDIIGVFTPETGTFRVPVFSKNDNMTMQIINDSPMPCKILSASLEAHYNDRAQRMNS